MNRKRKNKKFFNRIPEEWFLIRRTSPKMLPEAEELLRQTECYYVDLDDYQQKQQTNNIIADEFNYKYAHTILVHCTQHTMLQITNSHLFQKVWSGPHAGRSCLTLSGKEADQIHLLLRIQDTQGIEIVRRSPIPQDCQWKKQSILDGPLRGLEGQVVADRSNLRKFWFTTLPELRLLFLTPAILIKKQKKNILETQEVVNPGKRFWFMVYSRSIQNLEYAFLKDKNDALQKLQTEYFPSDENQETTIYYPEFIEHYKNGLDKKIPVFQHRYFIHTTHTEIETFRYNRPDSHVYVVRDRNYKPIRINEKDLRVFIQNLEEINQVPTPYDVEMFAKLKKGDSITFSINKDSTPIQGTIKQVKGSGIRFILNTDQGTISIQPQNIQLNDSLKQMLEQR